MSTRQDALNNLRDLHKLIGEIDLKCLLMDGTLLGTIRDGDFCPGDEDDIDIGIMDENYHQTTDLVNCLQLLNFKKFKDFIVRGKREGFGLVRGGSHFDIMRINRHPHRSECYNLGRMPRTGRIFAFVYPSFHFEKFDTAMLHAMKFLIPSDPEGFLKKKYGNWRVPIPRPGYVWWEDSNKDCMRFDYDRL